MENVVLILSNKLVFIFAILAALTLINYITKEYTNEAIILILLIGILYSVYEAYKIHSYIPILNAVGGFLILGLFLLIFAIISKNAIGGGDIKLMAAVGYIIGVKLAAIAVPVSLIIFGFIYLVGKLLDASRYTEADYEKYLPSGYLWLLVVLASTWIDSLILRFLE